MRKFYLVNELNVRYNLQKLRDYAYFTEPNGLGYENGYNYIKVGNAYKEDSKELKQGIISGNITFDSYEKYQEFVNYIENSENIRLIYDPYGKEFFRDIDIDGISKGEKSGRWLKCNIKFNCKGLFYLENSQEFVIEESEDDCRYPLPYGTQYNDYATILVDFYNNGHVDAEIIAEFDGFIQRPVMELYVNGKRKYKMLFDIVVQVGEKLFYSGKSGDHYIRLEDSNGIVTNAIDCLVLENDNFFKLPKGSVSLKITSDSGVTNRNVVNVLTSFKGV